MDNDTPVTPVMPVTPTVPVELPVTSPSLPVTGNSLAIDNDELISALHSLIVKQCADSSIPLADWYTAHCGNGRIAEVPAGLRTEDSMFFTSVL